MLTIVGAVVLALLLFSVPLIVIVGAVGFAIGGPIGAVVGAIIGTVLQAGGES